MDRRRIAALLGAGILAVTGCGTGLPASLATPAPSPAATTLPTATVTPTAQPTQVATAPVPSLSTPLPSGSGWRQVASAEVFGIAEVVWSGYRWVAVGSENGGENGDTVAIAWTSPDGIAWQRAAVDDPEGASMRAVVVAPAGGLIAVGLANAKWSDDADCLDPLVSADAAVWVSADGTRWDRVHDAALHGEPMADAVVLGDRVVAYGGAGCPGRSAAWTTGDGRSWRRAPGSSALTKGTMGSGTVMKGRILAVSDGLVWSSSDGRAWRVAPSPCAEGCGAIATDGSRVVLFGVTEAGLFAWRSADGRTWKGAKYADLDGPSMFAAIGIPGGFVAVGEGTILTSPDGVTWTYADVGGDSPYFYAVGAGPGGLLATGDQGVWIGPAEVAP